MIVTLSDLARSTATGLGLTEPDVKRARQRPFREHQDPKFLVAYAELEDGRTLRLNCCHHDPGQIVSLAVT
jgi:hypothetical protein